MNRPRAGGGARPPQQPDSPRAVERSLEDYLARANPRFPTTEATPTPPTEEALPTPPTLELDLDAELPASRRRVERTEIVMAPLPRGRRSWTANLVVLTVGCIGAFLVGAVLVFLVVRALMPAQPVVVPSPEPAAATTDESGSRPVVTPLDPAEEPAAAARVTPGTATSPDGAPIPTVMLRGKHRPPRAGKRARPIAVPDDDAADEPDRVAAPRAKETDESKD